MSIGHYLRISFYVSYNTLTIPELACSTFCCYQEMD